jgi:hypothetical protein
MDRSEAPVAGARAVPRINASGWPCPVLRSYDIDGSSTAAASLTVAKVTEVMRDKPSR